MIKKLLSWLVKPSVNIKPSEDRRKARLLSSILLIVIIALLIEHLMSGHISLIILFGLLLGYLASRTVYFHWAAIGCILFLSIPSFQVVLSLPNPTTFTVLGAFMWLVVPILLSSVYFSLWKTAVLLGLYTLGIVMMPVVDPDLNWGNMLGSLVYVVTIGVVVLVVMRQRELIERDRQRELRISEEQLLQALSAGNLGTWSWDLVTNLIDWSPQTEKIFGFAPGTFDHTVDAYLSRIYPEDLPAVTKAINTALNTTDSDYSVQHRILLEDDSIRWLEGRGRAAKDDKGKTIRLSGTVIDITLRRQYELEREYLLAEVEANNAELQREIMAREQTEIALRQSEETALDFQQKLITLQEVNIELSQVDSFDELCREAIILGRSRLGFDRLGIWLLDESDPKYMVGAFGTDEIGNLSDERELRLPVSPKEAFEVENPAKIPTKIWQESVLYNNKHEVVGKGWCVVALLWRESKVIGIISADNLIEKRPFSQNLQELLRLYASTLSNLIVQKQEEIKATQRRMMLEKVVELGKQVTQVADLQECLLRIYKSVKEDIGFDRVGLFLYDEATGLLHGTYGTDREGNRVGEWDLAFPADEITPNGQPLFLSDRVVFVSNYIEAYGFEVGEVEEIMEDVKEHVHVVSWVGEQPIALITADNLVGQRSITEEQLEALYLFGGYAGLAIENARLLAKVREAEQRYRSIFENAIEGIFQVSPQGRYLSVNPAAAHMFGFETPDQMMASITDNGAKLYIKPERRQELKQQLTEHNQVQNFEFEVVRYDGKRAWLSQNTQAVYDDQGELLHFEGIIQDVTARKLAAEELETLIRELEMRNAELERFTYTVSHDLKSPLITIQGFLGFVERDAIAGNMERFKEDIERISTAVKRMQQLLDELLELSRVGRLVNPAEDVAFADLVEEALSLASGHLMQGGVEVVVAPDLPTVSVDRRRLVEVLQNLLDNAAKFMGEQPEPRVNIGVKMDGAQACFFVQDNGTGIAPAYHERVFGLFERLDQSVDGTGIGLALVKRIIEVHNGRLWVESAGNGQGSTFYFTLPLANEGKGIAGS